MSIERCSLKLRCLTLVINTADLINERTTPTPGVSHAVISPVAIFTTYIFIGAMAVAALRQQFASYFLEIYIQLSCSVLHMYLSILVFRELKANTEEDNNAALVLNGILPMLIIFVLLADLIVILFSNRDLALPVLPEDSFQIPHLRPTI